MSGAGVAVGVPPPRGVHAVAVTRSVHAERGRDSPNRATTAAAASTHVRRGVATPCAHLPCFPFRRRTHVERGWCTAWRRCGLAKWKLGRGQRLLRFAPFARAGRCREVREDRQGREEDQVRH